jgi:hypothetical protein
MSIRRSSGKKWSHFFAESITITVSLLALGLFRAGSVSMAFPSRKKHTGGGASRLAVRLLAPIVRSPTMNLRHRSEADADALLGNFSSREANRRHGANGPNERKERAWRAYNQLRERPSCGRTALNFRPTSTNSIPISLTPIIASI